MKLIITASDHSSAPLICQVENCGVDSPSGTPEAAEYLLPKAGTTDWQIVCADHAEGWFKTADALYTRAAVRLAPLGEADKRFVVDSWD